MPSSAASWMAATVLAVVIPFGGHLPRAQAQDPPPLTPPLNETAPVPAPVPHPPAAITSNPSDPGDLSRQMAAQVRRLAQGLTSSLPASTTTDSLTRELLVLAKSLDEMPAAVGGGKETTDLGKKYSDLDASWHQLKGQIDKSGQTNYAIQRAARDVDDLDARLHQALKLDKPAQATATPTAPAAAPAPEPQPISETRRLAQSLADHARYLSAVVQADSVNAPNRARLVREVVDLNKQCDQYVESLKQTDRPDLARDGFARIAAITESLSQDLSTAGLAARTHTAWDAYVAANESLGQQLSMPATSLNLATSSGNASPAPRPTAAANDTAPTAASAAPAPASAAPSRLSQLADVLLNQSETLLRNFAPNVPYVPEGTYFLADVQALRDSAARFRQDVANGTDATGLTNEFRNAEGAWSRLAWRIYRITPYNPTPNGRLALSIGNPIASIRQELGTAGTQPAVASTASPAGAATVPQPVSGTAPLPPTGTAPVTVPAPVPAGGAAPAPAPPGTSAEPVRVTAPASGTPSRPAAVAPGAEPVPAPSPTNTTERPPTPPESTAEPVPLPPAPNPPRS